MANVTDILDSIMDAGMFTEAVTDAMAAVANTSTPFTTSLLTNDRIDDATTTAPPVVDESLAWDDATWILIASFIIFTMQSGFSLLEVGSVSCKNEVNILYKNASDVVFTGIAYWLFGYAFSFGRWSGANPFIGLGDFALDLKTPVGAGNIYVTYIFQLSFAATATTIVSGAVAERIKLGSYIIFCFFNVFTYAVVAHWIWDDIGFLYTMGVVDIAGSGVVHLCGGTASLVGAVMLGPRQGRYDGDTSALALGNGAAVILGTIMLWWGWLGFNCGSIFGVQGAKWVLAARSAVATVNGAIGGGLAGNFLSLAASKGRLFSVTDLCNGILGGLVSITAPCAVVETWEALVIGIVGGFIAFGAVRLLNCMKIDDPVGAIAVHGFCGVWGLLSVGLFMHEEPIDNLNKGNVGAFYGGGGYSFGIQLLACVCIITWTTILTAIIFGVLKLTVGIRMDADKEADGADYWEHGIENRETENHRGLMGLSRSCKHNFPNDNGAGSDNQGYQQETNGVTLRQVSAL